MHPFPIPLLRRLPHFVAAGFAGLATATLFPAPPPASGPAPATSSPAAVLESSERAPSTDYRIVANDQIRFRITGEPDDSASPLIQRVSSQGEISAPLLGAIKVAGLTLRETERLMEKRYRAEGFYVNPQVILSFETYAPRNVSVLGQVNNPNQLDFPIEHSAMGIVSAITRAGGFTRVARTDAVKVMRTVEGKEVSYTVNVAAYLNETAKEAQFQLQPDDIVFVPERVF
jgi:protein involved in polysaccharide export with SLBB domain